MSRELQVKLIEMGRSTWIQYHKADSTAEIETIICVWNFWAGFLDNSIYKTELRLKETSMWSLYGTCDGM